MKIAKLTLATREAFQENMAVAGKVGQLIDEIAAASQEQAQGIDQINTAVLEMDKLTQQTAAGAEESASASEELTAQAEQMKGAVSDLVAAIGGQVSKTAGPAAIRQDNKEKTARRQMVAGPPKMSAGRKPACTAMTSAPEKLISLDDEGFKDF